MSANHICMVHKFSPVCDLMCPYTMVWNDQTKLMIAAKGVASIILTCLSFLLIVFIVEPHTEVLEYVIAIEDDTATS